MAEASRWMRQLTLEGPKKPSSVAIAPGSLAREERSRDQTSVARCRLDQRRQASNRPGGYADREDVRGQVLHHHGPGPHDGVLPDRDTRAHDDAAPQPHVVGDGDRPAALDPGEALLWLDR